MTAAAPQAVVERAIVAQLSQNKLTPELVVESYAAQLDDELFGWIRTLPAAWVTFDGAQTERKGARGFKVSATFEVLVAQRNLRENDGRLNQATRGSDVGVYQLLEWAKLALANQTLDLAIQPLTPGAVRAVMKGLVNREAVVVYAQTFATSWMEVLPEPAAVPAGELATVGLNYLLKPGDDTVDASDELSLAPAG